MTRLALALALVPAASAAAATGPLHANRPDIVFGGGVVLSGKFDHGLADQSVVLLAKQHGETSYSSVALLETKAGGRWSSTVTPTIETSYEATSLAEHTPALAIKVRPRVTLARSRGRFVARVLSAASYEGHFVLLQRRGAHGWKTMRRIKLSQRPRKFDAKLSHGLSRLRIFLPRAQAGAGYLPGFSKTVLVRR
jgi:hypothetical protein